MLNAEIAGLKTTIEKGSFELAKKRTKRGADIITNLSMRYVRTYNHILWCPTTRCAR